MAIGESAAVRRLGLRPLLGAPLRPKPDDEAEGARSIVWVSGARDPDVRRPEEHVSGLRGFRAVLHHRLDWSARRPGPRGSDLLEKTPRDLRGRGVLGRLRLFLVRRLRDRLRHPGRGEQRRPTEHGVRPRAILQLREQSDWNSGPFYDAGGRMGPRVGSRLGARLGFLRSLAPRTLEKDYAEANASDRQARPVHGRSARTSRWPRPGSSTGTDDRGSLRHRGERPSRQAHVAEPDE